MDQWHSDLLINIISYFNVLDATAYASTSRRMYYLIHQYGRLLGPQLVSGSYNPNDNNNNDDDNDDDMEEEEDNVSKMYQTSLEKLCSRPNLALAFGARRQNDNDADLSCLLQRRLPGDAVVLGASASHIQANCADRVDADCASALMLGSFPPNQTRILPFCASNHRVDGLLEKLQQGTPKKEEEEDGVQLSNYWKVFIVYVCGAGYAAESFVSGLQRQYPDAAIVGGICNSGYVSSDHKEEEETPSRHDLSKMTVRQLRNVYRQYGGDDRYAAHVDQEEILEATWKLIAATSSQQYRVKQVTDGIFGIALGGSVPVRSIVSRGVRSVTTSGGESSCWFVERVIYAEPGDEDYVFRGDPALLKPVHMVRYIRNAVTGQLISPTALYSKVHDDPEYVGICRPGADGFELHPANPFSFRLGCLVLMTDGSDEQALPLDGANFDLFTLDGQACLDDLDVTLDRLQQVTAHEKILGGVMFSCSGRGPSQRSMLGESMADATRFHRHFPNVPCLGFYAGGEIGPAALAGNRHNVYQRGKAALQGFTVVFALFIVPVVEPGSIHINDSDQAVAEFLQEQWPLLKKTSLSA